MAKITIERNYGSKYFELEAEIETEVLDCIISDIHSTLLEEVEDKLKGQKPQVLYRGKPIKPNRAKEKSSE